MAAIFEPALQSRDRAIDNGGHVFGRFTVLALVLLIGVAAWYRQPAVVTLLGLTLATAGVSRLWSRASLKRIRCERTLSATSLFPDEQFTITVRLSNQKALPLPWLEIAQSTPYGMLRSGETVDGGAPVLARSVTMPWYSRLTWREPVSAGCRGYYTLPPLSLTSGDIIGLYPRLMEAGSYEHVAVYPRLYSVRRLPIQRADAAGELSGRLSLDEDPTRMRGIREYQPYDGLRRVHWKASAHHQQLMVKLHEPSAVTRVNLLLDVDSFNALNGDEQFELGISSCASIACHCTENHMQLGFLSNARLLSSSQQARLAPGSGSNQLVALLQMLARVTSGAHKNTQLLMDELKKVGQPGAAIVAVIGALREAHVNAFTRLQERRSPLLVLQVGAAPPPIGLPFSVRHIASPYDLLDLGGI